MKQTAVEFLWDMLLKGEFINDPEELLNQAKAKERIQKAKEYIKGFNDGKEFKKKLDELKNKKTCYHPLTERKHTSDIHFECTICGYNNY